jgi:hypothetical protein
MTRHGAGVTEAQIDIGVGSMSEISAPRAPATTIGLGLAHRVIQFIGTPYNIEDSARRWKSIERGCEAMNRSRSRSSMASTRPASTPELEVLAVMVGRLSAMW